MKSLASALLSLILLASPAHSRTQPKKRAVCIPDTLNDPLKDDVPAIASALRACGDTGRIIISTGKTYQIRSPLSLSTCRRCDFEINGVLNVSDDRSYSAAQARNGVKGVFTVNDRPTALYRSTPRGGVIEGNFLGESGVGAGGRSDDLPSLFSITNSSSQIHFSNFKVRNAPGAAFLVDGNSSSVYFEMIDFEAVGVGYEIQNAAHVYVWNNTIRASKACVQLGTGADQVQVQETVCDTSSSDSASVSSSSIDGLSPAGVLFDLVVGQGVDFVRDILVQKFTALGRMNVISILTDQQTSAQHNVIIYNASFTDVSMDDARQAVHFTQCASQEQGSGCGEKRAILNATDVVFRNFTGTAESESRLVCLNAEDRCQWEVEGWNVNDGIELGASE